MFTYVSAPPVCNAHGIQKKGSNWDPNSPIAILQWLEDSQRTKICCKQPTIRINVYVTCILSSNFRAILNFILYAFGLPLHGFSIELRLSQGKYSDVPRGIMFCYEQLWLNHRADELMAGICRFPFPLFFPLPNHTWGPRNPLATVLLPSSLLFKCLRPHPRSSSMTSFLRILPIPFEHRAQPPPA